MYPNRAIAVVAKILQLCLKTNFLMKMPVFTMAMDSYITYNCLVLKTELVNSRFQTISYN